LAYLPFKENRISNVGSTWLLENIWSRQMGIMPLCKVIVILSFTGPNNLRKETSFGSQKQAETTAKIPF